MKKVNLKSLKLNKKLVSNLQISKLNGGVNIESNIGASYLVLLCTCVAPSKENDASMCICK